jgi:hypothetical protein
MYEYDEYIGKITKKCPVDFGKKILKLNWNMSSSMIDCYIYKNDNEEFFYVTGAAQHTHLFCSNYREKSPNDFYHLVMIIPIKSKILLAEYLNGNLDFKKLFNLSGNCYILKLRAPFYTIWRGEPTELSYTMHPVKNGEEVTRKEELQVWEFDMVESKTCSIKKLPFLMNPNSKFKAESRFKYKGKMTWNFISEEDKQQITNFIKQTLNENNSKVRRAGNKKSNSKKSVKQI